MEFKNYETINNEIKKQINSTCEIWKKYLGEDLVGVYLHGSMCLNYFKEDTSDIDLLIITNRRIERNERLDIAREIIEVDVKPCPLEMSALYIQDIKPWHYPPKCQFHYSDFWTERYQKMISGEIKENFIIDCDFEDTDIASYIPVIKKWGVCLYGRPIDEVFPEVSEEDFWKSISNDIDEYDFNDYNEKYFVSNIIILGRILSYKIEKKILSKYEGGVWTMNYVPQKYRYIIENALNVWYANEKQLEYKQEDLQELRAYLIAKIKE